MTVKIIVTQEFLVRQGLKLRGGDSDQIQTLRKL